MIKKHAVILLAFCTLVSFVMAMLSCKQNLSNQQDLQERIVTFDIDSIGLRDPVWASHPISDVRLIDIKLFNDTIYLFTLIEKDDSLRLCTYYWDSLFHFIEHRIFLLDLPVSEEEMIYSIAAISYDTILLHRLQSIDLYDFISDAVFLSCKLSPHEILPANSSPVQYCKTKHAVYSEYIDYSKAPNSSTELYEGSLFCEISLTETQLNGLPFPEPECGSFRSMFAKAHFVITKQAVVVKYNFADEFEVFDRYKNRSRSQKVPIPISEIYQSASLHENTTNPDDIRDALSFYPTQQGMSFNLVQNTLFLFYTMPLQELDEDGLKSKYEDKPIWIIAFDSDLRPTEKLIIERPGFSSTMFFSVGNKLFFLSNQIIYTVTI